MSVGPKALYGSDVSFALLGHQSDGVNWLGLACPLVHLLTQIVEVNN